VDGANRHDCRLVAKTVESIPIHRPRRFHGEKPGMCLDKGYDSEEVRTLLRRFGFVAHIRSRGEEAKALKQRIGFRARRWVVERSHSWMNRFRRILIRWEKRLDTYFAMLHFACGIITWRAAGLLE